MEIYIVLRLLEYEDGSCCDNDKTLLGVFEKYEDALECASMYDNFTYDALGEDNSPCGEEIYAKSTRGHYGEKISIFKAPVN